MIDENYVEKTEQLTTDTDSVNALIQEPIFYFTLIESTTMHEYIEKQNYVAFHYAKQNCFTVKMNDYNMRLTIKEGDIFISKKASDYEILQFDDHLTTIISIYIHEKYFEEAFIQEMQKGKYINEFLNDSERKYSNLKFNKILPQERNLFNNILSSISKHPENENYMQLIVNNILLHIAFYYECTFDVFEKSDKAKIIEYVENHIKDANIIALAEKLHYSTSHTSEKVKIIFGKTFKALIRDQRLKKANSLVQNTNLSSQEISSEIGYANSCSFIKAFKKEFSYTPQQCEKYNNEEDDELEDEA